MIVQAVAGDVTGHSFLTGSSDSLNFPQWGGGWWGVCDPSLRLQTCSLYVFTLGELIEVHGF